MASEIIKTKFYCKSGCHTAPRGSQMGNLKWIAKFIEGKWYDGEYETWSSDDGYRLNGGWRRYWVVNESGVKEEISKSYMKTIFEMGIQEIRDKKIELIVGKEK